MKKMRKNVRIISILIMVLLLVLCSCSNTVENEKIKLDLNGIGEKEGTYSGELKKNLPNGNGKFETKNSSGETWYYEGEWVDGQMEGEGYEYWPDLGQKYEGLFANGKMIEGKIYQEDKLQYDGQVVSMNDMVFFDGKGKLYNAKGEVVYDGIFEMNRSKDLNQLKKNAAHASYDKLARNPEKYYGDLVKIEGQIIQVIEGEDGYAGYLVALDDWVEEVIYLTYARNEKTSRFLEGDEIIVYGQSCDLITYESTMGKKVTIPYVEGLSMKHK